jgi:phosphonate transport system substrate-binding protein
VTGAKSGELRLGLVPDVVDAKSRAEIAELCAALGHFLGMPVRPLIASAPEELRWAFDEHAADLAWLSPALLVTSQLDAVPLLCTVREGAASYHGALFVAEESTIRSTLDLKGAKAAWVAPTSASGYIFPRLALASHGLDPRDLFASEAFFGGHGDVAREVLTGRADVGATYVVFQDSNPSKPIVRSGFAEAAPGRRGRIVFVTPRIPADLIVASPALTPEVRDQVIAAFHRVASSADSDSALRHILGAEGFRAFDDGDLAPLRAQIEDGRTLGLLD